MNMKRLSVLIQLFYQYIRQQFAFSGISSFIVFFIHYYIMPLKLNNSIKLYLFTLTL